jgi:hypothetical protein
MFGNFFFKILISFNVIDNLNLSFFNLSFLNLVESNFIHVKNISYCYKKKNQNLFFFSETPR